LGKNLSEEFPYFQFDSEHIMNLNADESKTIQQSFIDIIKEYENNSSERDTLLRNYIHILLLRVREVYSRHKKKINQHTTRKQLLANRFKHMVEAGFIEQRTVHEYADQLNITPKYLSDVVKDTFGRSPLEMIHDMLLLEAKVLLRSTDKTVSEIAHALKFEDHAHFAHFIKKHTGDSPQALRRNL
jgi:AraC-like DNA-binding protein